MSRRSLTLAIAGLVTVAALAVAVLFPVPYVILTPGPTLNTLGEQSGQPLISITGRQTYPTSGHLNMVTISYEGGPGTNLNIFEALRAWLDPSEAVVSLGAWSCNRAGKRPSNTSGGSVRWSSTETIV